MKWVSKVSPLIRELELRKSPVIIRVNKFDEESAASFQNEIARAHSTGQEVIPVVISSYGGQAVGQYSSASAQME
jgi:50S ribosomal subunit-associated GTPase HflX